MDSGSVKICRLAGGESVMHGARYHKYNVPYGVSRFLVSAWLMLVYMSCYPAFVTDGLESGTRIRESG